MPTLTYTIAPTVEAGDPVSAGDLAGLAAAVNSRVLGGPGDCHWRIPYLFFTLFRQLRNPDELGNFPAEAEFFHLYQHLEPEDADWPLTGAGDPEGANVANPLMAYIAGSEALDLASERARLGAIPTDIEGRDLNVPLTGSQLRVLGEAQRGAYDPRTGLLASPMFDLAQTPMGIRVSTYSPYLNDFGGYLPGPARITPECAAIGDLVPPNRQVFFTNLTTGTVRSYDGTCPEEPTHIAHIAYLPLAYIVYLNNGQVDYLPKNRWIEGPYTADAELRKADGGLLSRVQTAFASEFRGSTTQRQEADGGVSQGFQLQDFLTRQYGLAPQLGRELGGGRVEALYPDFRATGSAGEVMLRGTALRDRRFGQQFPVPGGFVTTHLFVKVAGVKRSFRLGIYAGETLEETLAVTVAGYGADAVVALETPRRIGPLRVKLLEAVEFAEAGSIEVSATVLLEYKPSKEDWFSVVRVGSWVASFDQVDGRGIDEENARALSDSLLNYGCLLRTNQASDTAPAGTEPPVNKNAVFEAARQLSKCVRIARRQQVVRYAVEDGKSIIWVRRFAYGMHFGTPADLMAGIAPSWTEIAAEDLEIGQRYTVQSGTVKHGGRTYTAGQSFTPTQACTGDGLCLEAEGIRARALRGGFSNRWCLSLTFDPYHPSTTSIWKPDGFADQKAPFGNRCLFDDPDAASDSRVLLHGAFGVKPFYKSEMPSGYRYVPTPLSTWGRDNANQGASEEFFRSCRVYEPPLEIESATIEGTGADTLVKLVLTGRLHHHHSLAPASVSDDMTSWDLGDLTAESQDYATDENRLRQYLVNQFVGGNCDASGPGNASYNSTIQSDPDNPFGTCYPNVLLVKLIPEPWLDGNDVADGDDSPALSEHLRLVEMYLRAMCSGFVDGRTTGVNACASSTTTVYDYSWPNLWFDAIGNRYLPLLPESVRPDNPEGHGPGPITRKYAALFNGLSAATNRLTRVRVMLPMTLENRTRTTYYDVDVTDEVRIASGGIASIEGRTSDSGADYAVWLHTGPRAGGTVSTADTGWVPGTTGGVATGVNLFLDSGSIFLRTSRQQIDWRWAPDSGSEFALPENISGLVETGAGVVLQTQVLLGWEKRTLVSGSTNGTQCSATGSVSSDWQTGTGDAVFFDSEVVTEDPECVSFGSPISGGEPKVADVWLLDAIAGDSDPGCLGATTRTVNVTALNANTPVLVIPTTAYGGGS